MISGSRRSSLYRSIIGGNLATILVAPQQFGSLTVFYDTHDTQIGLGITVNILEILAGAVTIKILPMMEVASKPRGIVRITLFRSWYSPTYSVFSR